MRYRDALGPLVTALVERRPDPGLTLLREKPGRRRLACGTLPDGERCFFKHYAPDGRRRPVPEWAKRALRLETGAREFATHRRLAARGIPVPDPIAYFRCDDRSEVVVTRFLEGESLIDALRRPAPERRALLEEVGRLVSRLHDAGSAHRDLHGENVWITSTGPVLIDLQAALPSSARWLRRRDLGELDASLRPHLSLADRVRLRGAELGVPRPWSPAARRAIRDIGTASKQRTRAHVESRTRRCLQPGRLYAALGDDGATGMRWRAADEGEIRARLSENEAQHFDPAARGREGTPARTAWIAGHGLRARGVAAPLPLAFLEHGNGRSTLALEPHDPLRADDIAAPETLERVIEIAVALQRFDVDHATLSPAALCRDASGRIALTRLSDVRFPRRLRAPGRARIDALVTEVARASDASDAERQAALRRYRVRLRFEGVPIVTAAAPTGAATRGSA